MQQDELAAAVVFLRTSGSEPRQRRNLRCQRWRKRKIHGGIL